MNNRVKLLGMPAKCGMAVIAVLIVGIIAGSFWDMDISMVLLNKTDIGAFFATYGLYFSYCLYPAAGMCLFLGLREYGEKCRMLAWVLLIGAYFLAVYYSNSYSGGKLRTLFGYTAGESSPWISLLSWLFWVVLYAWVPPVCYAVLDKTQPRKLIAVGAVILAAGVLSDNVNLWLKQAASRPRFKYLLTLDDPFSEYRSWWQWVPNLAGSNDSYKSWPSGNMTIACMMFALPTLADVTKNRSVKRNAICFAIACGFVLLYGYNRIHMSNHFLTDVCFGTLFTYLIFAVTDRGFHRALDE